MLFSPNGAAKKRQENGVSGNGVKDSSSVVKRVSSGDLRVMESRSMLEESAEEIRTHLKKMNQAQAAESNAMYLQSSKVGGTVGLASKFLLTDIRGGGIQRETADLRRELFGPNTLPVAPRKTFFELFVDTFDDATLQILMVAAVVSLAIGIYEDPTAGYVEGCAILTAVMIVSVVTALNDYQKESQFRELSQTADDGADVVVVRNGSHWQIPAADLVVGDVVCFEAGDEIPCDGILLSADDVQVDESALTGEPVDVNKHVLPAISDVAGSAALPDPFMLSGCTVESGSGQMLAIAVGKESQWGVIKSHLEKEQDQTPLQEKLDDMAAFIGYIGMGFALATFAAMMFIKLVLKPDYLENVSVFNYALEAFIIGVTIVVVAVPEGLPLAVTISLAFSTKKMLADQNLIRHLAACETMGNATNICSDKTGTLTENRMTVVKGCFADTRCDDTINRVPILISRNALEIILDCIACCSTAKIIREPGQQDQGQGQAALLGSPRIQSVPSGDDDDDVMMRRDVSERSLGTGSGHSTRGPDSPFRSLAASSPAAFAPEAVPQGPVKIVGNKTDASLLLLAQSAWSPHDDTDARRAAANFHKEGGSKIFPFSSSRKRMSVLVTKDTPLSEVPGRVTRSSAQQLAKQQIWTLYQKGAAEIVLANCSHYLDIDGTEREMSDKKRKEFGKIIKEFAHDALRCVALAHKSNIQNLLDPHKATADQCDRDKEKDLCLDAITGIMDPLRPDVIEAVSTCQQAGIFVRMVTGDNVDTAVAIAKKAGILTEDGLYMTGPEFRKLTPSQLDEILPRLQVLARSSPEDKHMLVKRLNGALMPNNEEEWLEMHPGMNFERDRDTLLPGYKEEWAESRNGVGEVVGVTGDGTNDGPALKAADVGLSMGLCGTDVAKKASDIIIMDDNFSSIVKAVLWGRSVFDNIRKFLQFQLTVNVVALTITFLAALVGYQPPLNAVMMLWVNLIMDTMGALALGTEPPRADLLDRRPYRRDASLISRPMWRNILCQAIYQLCVLVFLLKSGPGMFKCEDGSRHHFTIIFNAFVFCQVFNEFNAREIGDVFDPVRSLQSSPMFMMVICFTVVAQWFIVEFGGDFTQTYSLGKQEWYVTVGLGAMSLPVGYVMRLIPVSEDPATFAGIESQGESKKVKRSWLAGLVVAVIPVFFAIVYQLYYEIDEFVHEHEGYQSLAADQ